MKSALIMLALAVSNNASFAADTAEEAERLDAPRRAATLAFQTGVRERFGTIEAAQAFPAM